MDKETEVLLASRREWLGLLVLSLPCMLYSMDLTVLNLALPRISLDLRPSASQLLWIVDVYGFFVAGSLITMGSLDDRIGRRKMLLIGATVFALASACAAFSRSPEILILTRALQGIAGATLAPSTLSLIRILFRDPRQRAMAVGLWGTSFSVGSLIGPIVGGSLIEHFWWGSVFLINLPIMVLLLIIGPVLLPEYKDPESGRIDLVSAALSLVAILLIIFGLKKIAELGFEMPPLASIATGLVLGFAFIKRQKNLRYPLIDLRLFKSTIFRALIVTNSLTMFVFFGTFIFTSQYLQLVMGLSPLVAGLWSLPSSVGVVFSSSLSPLLARKIKPAYVMGLGLLLGTIGFLMISRVQGVADLPLLVAATIVFSFGSAPVLLFTTNMLVNSAPPEKAGSAAAVSETGNELGGALGIALLGSVGTFMYRNQIAKTVSQSLSPELKSAAMSTLENALDVAKSAPVDIGGVLAQQAQNAYTVAFQNVMLIASAILFALSILVLTKLRDVRLEAQSGD